MGDRNETLSIRVNNITKSRLKQMASKLHIPMSAMVYQWVMEKVDAKYPPPPPTE